MAMASKDSQDKIYCFENVRHFPPVVNGRINIIKFLEATTDLVRIVDKLGKAFASVKYDMQGNIDKITKNYKYNDNSCILELMLDEINHGKLTVAEGILWLNRALLYFKIAFQEILTCLQNENYEIDTKKIFTKAYENSIKKYHNWVTQQLASLACKMSPSLQQIMKSFEVEEIEDFETRLTNFNVALHLVTCKIDEFFKDNQLFTEKL